MGNATGWRLATAVLSLTTLGLTAALLVRPEAEPQIVFRTTEVPVEPVAEDRTADREGRERPRVEPTPPPETVRLTDADVMEQLRVARLEEARERLAEMPLDDVFRRELIASNRPPVPTQAIVARLLEDRETSSRRLLDWWAARQSEEWKELGLQLSPHFSTVFLEVVGDPAVVLVRAEWLQQRTPALMSALVTTGDEETLRTIDEDHRQRHVRRSVNPYLLVTLGPAGRELVWGWIEDTTVQPRIRETAIGGMWASGTEADRQRLWRTMDDTVKLVHFAPHAPRDGGVWSERLRALTAQRLDDPDPWVRLHASLAAMQNTFIWGNELARRGEAVATETTRLPMPGGRDANAWKQLLHKIEAHRPRVTAKSADEDAIREALGLE